MLFFFFNNYLSVRNRDVWILILTQMYYLFIADYANSCYILPYRRGKAIGGLKGQRVLNGRKEMAVKLRLAVNHSD